MGGMAKGEVVRATSPFAFRGFGFDGWLVAAEPAYAGELGLVGGRVGASELADAIGIDGGAVGVHEGKVEVEHASCAGVTCHSEVLAALDVGGARLGA